MVLLMAVLLMAVLLLVVKVALPVAKAALVDRWDDKMGDKRWVVMITMDK